MLAAQPSAEQKVAIQIWSAAFLLIGVLGGPMLEDDHHRFLWDGYRFAMDGTPYGRPPSDWFDDPRVAPSLIPHLEQLNYPDLPTIYAPLAAWLFRLGHTIQPAAVWPLATMQVLAAIALVALLARHLSPRLLLLLAWNPLLVIQLGFMAHPEGPGMLLAVAAVLALRLGRAWRAGALLGAACAARLSFLVLLPLALARGRLRAVLAASAVMAAAWAPFVMLGASEAAVLGVFASEWQFNAGAYYLLDALTGQGRRLVAVASGLAALVLAWRVYRHNTDALPLAAAILLALPPLLGPVCNAWYLLWALPFAALAGLRVAPWVISASVWLSYGTAHNLGLAKVELFNIPVPLLVVEHGLIWAAIGYEAVFGAQCAEGIGATVKSVSSR